MSVSVSDMLSGMCGVYVCVRVDFKSVSLVQKWRGCTFAVLLRKMWAFLFFVMYFRCAVA